MKNDGLKPVILFPGPKVLPAGPEIFEFQLYPCKCLVNLKETFKALMILK
jgi:hypothetical protein